MSGIRVHELAKEMGVSSKELLSKLAEAGVAVPNHFAALSDADIEKVRPRPKPAEAAPAAPAAPGAVAAPGAASAPGAPPASGAAAPAPAPAPWAQRVPQRPGQRGRGKQRPSGRPAPRQPTGQVVLKPALPPREGGSKRGRKTLTMPMGITVKEFSERVGKPATELIKKLMTMGEMLTINSAMSEEAVTALADEMGFDVNLISPEEQFEEETVAERPEDLAGRSPVVTVMGHVDHGKTLLLDAIRRSDVVSSEAGGITQHIGASQVVHHGKPITFIDTPGHEAFTQMRARGARVTDIAVLVVAADDGVMPQTVEAIDHAKAAGVPIVVAVNKIDKDQAEPEKVRRELSEHGLVPEEWGGDTIFVDVSAKQKLHIDDLLEMLLLVSEVAEFKANPTGHAKGVVIEAKLDKGRGPVATMLVQNGTLKVGDAVVAGLAHGRVRALVDWHGNQLTEAGPSTAVEVLGLSQPPNAGDELRVVADERTARQLAEDRALKRRLLAAEEQRKHISLEDLFDQIQQGKMTELRLVIKADVQGSVEALKDALGKLDQSEVKLVTIHSGVGAISETDVMLASASDAIVVGFNVRPEPKARQMAEREMVDVRLYQVIYKVIEDINAARVGMLAPEYVEEELARVEVRQTFKVPKIGLVAGCYVAEGEVVRDAQARLVRDGVVVFDGKIGSLRRFKDDVKSVKAGFECGIGLEAFNDVKEGDVIEAYRTIEVAATG